MVKVADHQGWEQERITFDLTERARARHSRIWCFISSFWSSLLQYIERLFRPPVGLTNSSEQQEVYIFIDKGTWLTQNIIWIIRSSFTQIRKVDVIIFASSIEVKKSCCHSGTTNKQSLQCIAIKSNPRYLRLIRSWESHICKPRICHNHHYCWLCKKTFAKCKIFLIGTQKHCKIIHTV